MKIRIIGTGSWASALCQVLVDNNHDVLMLGIDESEISDINTNHRNSKYFDTILNEKVKASSDFNLLKEADIVLLAVPVAAIRSVLTNNKNNIKNGAIIINVAKGFDKETNDRLSVMIKEILQDKIKDVVSLVGPSHAEEVVLRLMTLVNAVCENEDSSRVIQELFSNQYFRVYRNKDVIGAEIGSAVKNIMAIASGILAGLNQGDNARAALMTRGLAEMTRFGMIFGANKETFLGLNGVGDLIVTCSSYHSRNFQAGLNIGKNDGVLDFFNQNHKTTEGVGACKIVYEIAKEKNIEMPITEAVYRILYENKKPSDELSTLMKRSLKAEEI